MSYNKLFALSSKCVCEHLLIAYTYLTEITKWHYKKSYLKMTQFHMPLALSINSKVEQQQ